MASSDHDATALDAFRLVSDKIASAITTCVIQVGSKLCVEGVLTTQFQDEIVNGSDVSYTKAQKLILELQRSLKIDTHPNELLKNVMAVIKKEIPPRLADQIETIMTSSMTSQVYTGNGCNDNERACDIFLHYHKLMDETLSNCNEIAMMLKEEHVIEVAPTDCKILLKDVKCAIRTNHLNLEKFGHVCRKAHNEDIAIKILASYYKTCPSREESVHQLVLRVTEIFQRSQSSDDLNKRAANFMCKPPFQFRHQSIMRHNTVVECLALIGERCSAHDTTPLKEFLQQFSCQHAIEEVEKYENEDKPDDIKPPFSLKCEKVVIVFKNGAKPDIVKRLFPRSSVRVRHITGNIITCNFDCDSTLLIKEAYENIDICKESLEELVIGFFEIWDRKAHDDEQAVLLSKEKEYENQIDELHEKLKSKNEMIKKMHLEIEYTRHTSEHNMKAANAEAEKAAKQEEELKKEIAILRDKISNLGVELHVMKELQKQSLDVNRSNDETKDPPLKKHKVTQVEGDIQNDYLYISEGIIEISAPSPETCQSIAIDSSVALKVSLCNSYSDSASILLFRLQSALVYDLSINCTPLNAESVSSIVRFANLEKLELVNVSFYPNDLLFLIRSLTCSDSLTSLHIQLDSHMLSFLSSHGAADRAKVIVDLLKRNATLTHLSLFGMYFDEDAVMLIFKALAESSTIHLLSLDRCYQPIAKQYIEDNPNDIVKPKSC